MPVQIPLQDNERDYYVIRLTVFQTQLGIPDAISWLWDGIGLNGWFKARRPDTVTPNPRPGVAFLITENYTLINMRNIKDGFFPDLPDALFEQITCSFEPYEGVDSVIFNMGPEHPAEP